jgi:hypothetical protein
VHVAVAVIACAPPNPTVGEAGLKATETRVMVDTVIVITVELSLVTPLSVALTYMPTVPEVVPAMKLTEGPEPVIEPMETLVSAHT